VRASPNAFRKFIVYQAIFSLYKFQQ
jgi:hypothetical protein